MARNWEAHKCEIQELFINQNYALEEVREHMRTNHSFSASKTEYERQLNRWKVRKNIKGPHARFLKCRLEIRGQQSKETVILVGGRQLQKLEIDQKIRSKFIGTSERYTIERSRTPEDIVVITPTDDSYMVSIKKDSLPWREFENLIASVGGLERIIHVPDAMLADMAPNLCPQPSTEIMLRQSYELETTYEYLCSVMPSEDESSIVAMLGQIFRGSSTIEFLKMALFLLSNNLLPNYSRGARYGSVPTSGTAFVNQLLQWFQMGSNFTFLRTIVSNKTPTIEAIAEKLLPAAVVLEAGQLVKILLEAGFSPHLPIIHGNGVFEQPLQHVANTGNLSLIKLLFEHGVDANLRTRNVGKSALQIASQRGHAQIMRLLISNGALVNTNEQFWSSALQYAVLSRSSEAVKLLIDKGANVRSHFGNAGTPIECAIRTRREDIFEMLLEAGADINERGEVDLNTPLQTAAMINDEDMINRLLQLGADCNAPAAWHEGRTALQYAAENGNLGACLSLLQAGANVNAPPAQAGNGETALAAAVRSENYELVQFLLNHGANVNDDRGRQTCLETAMLYGEVETLRLIISAGADVTRSQPIILAARSGNRDKIKALLDAGADINASHDDPDEKSVLWPALMQNDSQLIRFLFQAGARLDLPVNHGLIAQAALYSDSETLAVLLEEAVNPSYAVPVPGSCPLTALAQKGNIERLRLFLARGKQIDYNQTMHEARKALKIATKRRKFEVVRFLIEEGVEMGRDLDDGGVIVAATQHASIETVLLLLQHGFGVNQLVTDELGDNGDGESPLSAAVRRADIRLVEVLLAAGAKVDGDPEHPHIAIKAAASIGNTFLIDLLIQHGANVNAPPVRFGGLTALQRAAEAGHCGTVEFLIAKGANVNAPASYAMGKTALQVAAGNGFIRIAKILIDAGAIVDAPGSEVGGYTALEMAAAGGRMDMLKFLLNHGAVITGKGRPQLQRACALAKENGHDAAAKLLKYHQLC